jgi:hypothetical protein
MVVNRRWYVYIDESPGEEDAKKGRCEGKVLSEMLRLIGIEPEYRSVRTMQEWENALTEFPDRVRTGNRSPLIHLSLHGGKESEGLHLTDGTMVEPDVLGNQFRRVNERLNGKLLTCLSACSGFFPAAYACRGDVPFGMLIAPAKEVGWDEAALWYCVFYYRLYRDLDPTTAGRAANAALGNDELFSCLTQDTLDKVLRRRDEFRESREHNR